MGSEMKSFNVMWVDWKMQFLGGGVNKKEIASKGEYFSLQI